MYVNSNWIDAQKTNHRKCEAPLCRGWKPNSFRKTLIFIERRSLSLFKKVHVFRMRFNLSDIFARSEMSLNVPK